MDCNHWQHSECCFRSTCNVINASFCSCSVQLQLSQEGRHYCWKPHCPVDALCVVRGQNTIFIRVRIVAKSPSYPHNVRLSACIIASPTGRISVKFDWYGWLFMKNSGNPNLVEIGQKYRTLHMKTKESIFFVAVDVRSPLKRCVRVQWYHVFMLVEKV